MLEKIEEINGVEPYKSEYNKDIHLETNDIHHGDCMELMNGIPDKSVDMILCDLPYGRTKNEWDNIIPFDKLWEQYNRIAKDNAAIVLFADGMFMADLMSSNRDMWKYNIVWDKVLSSGFLNANRQPLRRHEEVVVFYKNQPTYNPQKTKGNPNNSKGIAKDCENNNYGDYKFIDNKDDLGDMKHPTSIQAFSKPHPSVSMFPTEKPVTFIDWLVKTYTNEGDIVLDNCMGSGTTAVSCINTNRDFIGIEIDKKNHKLSKDRVAAAKGE